MRLWKPGELIEYEFEEPLWLCEPLMMLGGITLVHGAPGCGKTQFLLTLAKAVLDGDPFLNMYPCLRGQVALFEMDMITKLVKHRLEKVAQQFEGRPFYQVTDESFMDIFKMVKKPPPEIQVLQQMQPEAVMVDTYKRSYLLKPNQTFSASENEATEVYDAWRSIFPHSGLIFTHHDRKKPSKMGFASDDPDERYSGMATVIGSADTGIHLTKDKRYHDKHITKFTLSKNRLCEEQPPIYLEMDAETLLFGPSKPTTKQIASLFLSENPDAEEIQIVNHVIAQAKCSRATAYRAAKWAQDTAVS
jgi:RecA-family ATPase